MAASHPFQYVRAHRELRGISAAQIADRLGIKVNSYHRYEAGTRRMYADHLLVILSMLAMRLDDLLLPPVGLPEDQEAGAGIVVAADLPPPPPEELLAGWDTELHQ